MAANDNTQKLVWLYEAQNKDVLKKLNQIERQTKKSFSKSTKQVKSFNMTMQKGSSLAKTFAASLAGFGGLAIGAGLSGLASSIKDVVGEASTLAKTADLIGVTTDQLQRMQYGFGLAGVSVSETENALQQFGKRLAEAESKGGMLAKILESNNISLRNSRGEMKPLTELLGEYANLIQNAGSEQERLSLANEAFGRSGATMVLALRNGEGGMRSFMNAADDAGGVLREDLLREMEKVDDEFARLARTVGMTMKSAVLELVAAFGKLDEATPVDTLKEKYGELLKRRKSLTQEVRLANLDQDEGKIAELNKALDALDTRIIAMQKRRKEVFERRQAGLSDEPSPMLPQSAPRSKIGVANDNQTYIPPSGSGGAGAPRSSSASDTDKIKERIAALQAEYDAIGQNATQQRVMNELRSSGADAASEQGRQMEVLVLSIDKATKRQESMNYLSQQFENLGMNAFANVTNQIDTGNDALDTFLQTLAQASIQAAMFGSGPMAGLFGGGGGLFGFIGSMFGGFFADGGYLGAGKWGIAGENGPEPIKGPATVVPANKASGSQNTVVHVVPSDMFEIVMDRRAGAVVDSASGGIVSTAVGMANQTAPAAMAQHQLLTGGDWRNVG